MGNTIDWSLAGPGAIATLRCKGEATIIDYDKQGRNHYVKFQDGASYDYENSGQMYSDYKSPFDIIHIGPAKVEESPLRQYEIKIDKRYVPDEFYKAVCAIFKLASTNLPTYQRVLEQMKGVK